MPMNVCDHSADIFCETCRPDYAYPEPPRHCAHCYCQPGPRINHVAHLLCCKCGERQQSSALAQRGREAAWYPLMTAWPLPSLAATPRAAGGM